MRVIGMEKLKAVVFEHISDRIESNIELYEISLTAAPANPAARAYLG